jgi:hypothetical protein
MMMQQYCKMHTTTIIRYYGNPQGKQKLDWRLPPYIIRMDKSYNDDELLNLLKYE